MKIALIGYGKMGRMIEKIAKDRGHEIVAIIDIDNQQDFDSEAFRSADCAIEFTTPHTAVNNIKRSFAAGVPVVVGSTGWTEEMPLIEATCKEANSAFIFASNYSVGVNIFMALNRKLSEIMARFPEYTPRMVETHHIHKLDHPSGTAITLAEDLIAENSRIIGWHEPEPDGKSWTADKTNGISMEIEHLREGEVPGIHTIEWDSPVDYISITHSAKSREGFALGAVLAAEWLPGHSGRHYIGEVLNL